MEKLSLNG